MLSDYTVIYINTDEVGFSEVIGVYQDLGNAVEALIDAAHYDQVDGVLRQYRIPTDDYPSYDELYNNVYDNLFLEDYDVYLIKTNVYD